MSWRNGLDNPTLHDFLGDLAPGPVRDGTLFWLLASKGDQLAELLCGNLRRPPWSGSIAEPLTHREIFQRDLLPPNPAHAPNCEPYPRWPPSPSQFVHSFFLRRLPKSSGLVEPVVAAYCVAAPALLTLFSQSRSISARLVGVLALILSSFLWRFPPILPQRDFGLCVLALSLRGMLI